MFFLLVWDLKIQEPCVSMLTKSWQNHCVFQIKCRTKIQRPCYGKVFLTLKTHIWHMLAYLEMLLIWCVLTNSMSFWIVFDARWNLSQRFLPYMRFYSLVLNYVLSIPEKLLQEMVHFVFLFQYDRLNWKGIKNTLRRVFGWRQ